MDEFGKIASEVPGSEELNKAKESIKGRLVLELEDSREVSTLFGLQKLLEGEIRSPETLMAEIDKVSSEQVTEVAKKIFVNEGMNLAVIGPFKEEDRFIKNLKF